MQDCSAKILITICELHPLAKASVDLSKHSIHTVVAKTQVCKFKITKITLKKILIF